MAKRINVGRIRVFLYLIGLAALILIAIMPTLGRRQDVQPIEVNPAFAPAEYAYPEYFLSQELSNGMSWRLTEDNTLHLTDGTGEYFITPDGTVYQDSGYGLEEVTDQAAIDRINAALEEARADSEAADDFFTAPTAEEMAAFSEAGLSEDLINDLLEAGFTPDDIQALIDAGFSPEEIQALLDAGYMPEQIEQLLEAGFTPDQIADILEAGATPEEIQALLDSGFTPDEIAELLGVPSVTPETFGRDYSSLSDEEIDRLLADTIAGTGYTVDDLKDVLEQVGLTPEEYLRGVETMGAQIPVVPTVPNGLSTNASALTVGDMPPMTINLGGDEGSVDEQEEQWQATYGQQVDPTQLASAIAASTATKSDYEAQNNQAAKNEFASSFSGNTGAGFLNKSHIASGTIITMNLRTGINTDLPGMVVAEVSQNVYDSLTGTELLIPKGTRLLASYDSNVSWGQKRALVIWTEMIRPDGYVLRLPGFPGVDKAGYAGYHDRVDNHTWELIGSAFLASIMDLGASEIINRTSDNNLTLSQAIADAINPLESAGQDYLDKQMNLQPTLTIRPGRTVKLIVNQTISLPPYIAR